MPAADQPSASFPPPSPSFQSRASQSLRAQLCLPLSLPSPFAQPAKTNTSSRVEQSFGLRSRGGRDRSRISVNPNFNLKDSSQESHRQAGWAKPKADQSFTNEPFLSVFFAYMSSLSTCQNATISVGEVGCISHTGLQQTTPPSKSKQPQLNSRETNLMINNQHNVVKYSLPKNFVPHGKRTPR